MLDLDRITSDNKRILWIVAGITACMFLLETIAGHIFSSHALRADALDFLDDTLNYTLSLAVAGAGLRMRAAAAAFKAGLLCIMCLWVLVSAIHHLPLERLPGTEVMGIVGLLGVASNALCLTLLDRFGQPADYLQTNSESIRHDMVGSAAVVVTAGAVWAVDAAWPDLVIAIVAASHLLWLSFQTLRQAFALYRAN